MTKALLAPLFAPLALILLSGCLPSEPVDEIPTALQGRWALVPADCDPTRPDAKGLMEVGSHDLSFYESRAVLDRVSTRSADRVQGSFLFNGEGSAWTRLVTLALSEDGLTRRETAPDGEVPPLMLDYTRCPEGTS